MLKQLDVKLFLQRINFCERGLEFLLKKKNVNEKQFYQLETLAVLKKRRRKYRLMKDKE